MFRKHAVIRSIIFTPWSLYWWWKRKNFTAILSFPHDLFDARFSGSIKCFIKLFRPVKVILYMFEKTFCGVLVSVETICIEYDRTFFVRSKKAIHSINNIRPCLVYVMLKCGDIVGFYVFFICFVRILILLAYHLWCIKILLATALYYTKTSG